ncbi:MAG TPA: DUF5362 family protein [candidate division Zixibacteria bacterium]|nr:DUF5362 family protein [candidate division Zixibacteria bacterium]
MEEQSINIDERTIVKEISLPIYQAKFWLKLLGVVNMIMGILAALTLIGIIIAWLPIWLGYLLFKAAGSIDGGQMNGDKSMLIDALNKLKTYFVINGVLMLIGVAGWIISMLVGGLAMLGGLGNM